MKTVYTMFEQFPDAEWVYFALDWHSRLVKIGHTKRPDQRMREIAKDARAFLRHPIIRLVGVFPGGRPEEQATHQRLRDHRHIGEWFHYSKEVQDVCYELCIDWRGFTRKPIAENVDPRTHDALLKVAHDEFDGDVGLAIDALVGRALRIDMDLAVSEAAFLNDPRALMVGAPRRRPVGT